VTRMDIPEGFKQTEVGVIPSDWEVRKLTDIGEIIIGLTYSPSNVKPYGTIVLRSSNIQNGKLAFKDNVYVVMDLPNRVIVKRNDILICVRNGSRQLIGKCALIDEETAGSAFGAFMSVFRSEFAIFAFHQFQYFIIQKQINEVLGATINQITNKDLASFKIPLPSTKTEQTAIATALNDADQLITQLEQLIAKKRNIKQGAMQTLLKPKEGWGVRKLGEIGECIIGLTYSPKNVSNDGKLVLRSSNIKGNKIAYDDNVFVNIEVPEKLITKKGDILICVRNGSRNLIGKCAYIEGRSVGESFGAFMSVFRSPYNDYVFHVFQSNIIKLQIDEQISATINQLTNKNLNSFEIPFPKPEEQTQIAQILTDMDTELEALEQKLAKYRMLKQGMMQTLLTGKTRLVKPSPT